MNNFRCIVLFKTTKCLQLGQASLNPPRLGSKCGEWVEKLSDFENTKDISKITQPLYPLTPL